MAHPTQLSLSRDGQFEADQALDALELAALGLIAQG